MIAHFRLLGDDRRLPYGTSVLEKARRIWKQLILSEDSMLVYRVTRAPERRVYKIFVGNIDDADVEAYVNTIADRFKRMPITDPQTGQIDLRYNMMSNDQDFSSQLELKMHLTLLMYCLVLRPNCRYRILTKKLIYSS
jgi:hypothetical protein